MIRADIETNARILATIKTTARSFWSVRGNVDSPSAHHESACSRTPFPVSALFFFAISILRLRVEVLSSSLRFYKDGSNFFFVEVREIAQRDTEIPQHGTDWDQN